MGKFVINATTTGYTFRLKAGNGETIATGGEVYANVENCKSGCESVIVNAPAANLEDQTVAGFEQQKHPKFEIYKDNAGEFRFRLKARNGQVIAISAGYVKKDSCKKGIESVRKNAASSPIFSPEVEHLN